MIKPIKILFWGTVIADSIQVVQQMTIEELYYHRLRTVEGTMCYSLFEELKPSIKIETSKNENTSFHDAYTFVLKRAWFAQCENMRIFFYLSFLLSIWSSLRRDKIIILDQKTLRILLMWLILYCSTRINGAKIVRHCERNWKRARSWKGE